MKVGDGEIREREDTDGPVSRRRDLLELGVGYGLILLVIWTQRPWQRVLYCVEVLFVAVVMWKRFVSWRAMGLRRTNLGRSSWVVAAALAAAAVAVLVASRERTLHDVGGLKQFVARYWGYALWAFVQQILLQDFFLWRLRRLLPGMSAVTVAVAAAGMFSLAHLPNPILTTVTLVWGLVACLAFLRYRNLYPLGLAHAILGIAVAVTLPGPVIRNMRVGRGYLTYRVHRQHRDHVERLGDLGGEFRRTPPDAH
jgi:membrane protease YdiL (CAAX protease family)